MVKSQGWHDEEKHLEHILSEYDKSIHAEQQRLSQEGLDDKRQEDISHRIWQLQQQKTSPYFGRMDALFQGEEDVETLYIGASTFFDEKDNVKIYDWRAPISSLFYEGTLGDLQFETPAGKQQAHVSLKRDIVIRKGQIQSLYDVENEEARLMETLQASSSKDGRLASITATIQKEQNDIIRHKQKDWLLVNGCAGSGKTTILLQRVAYLMYYANKEQLNDMLLLSRNKLFGHYISHVIPSLTGSELFQQTLWEKTEELFREMYLHVGTELVESEDVDQDKMYLPDKEWLHLLNQQVATLSIEQLSFRPITIKGYPLFRDADYAKLVSQVNPTLPLHRQMVQIQAALEKSLTRRLNRFFLSTRAEVFYERLSKAQLEMIAREKEFQNESEYKQYMGQKLFTKEIESVKQQIEVFAFVDVVTQFKKWLPLFKHHRQEIGRVRNIQAPLKFSDVQKTKVTHEGVRVLLYLKTLLTPARDYDGYSYLFIDEIQDVSLLLLGALSRYYFKTKFTVVGDAYQAFHDYPTVFSLGEQAPLVFGDRVSQTRELAISYRCTKQITQFANGILGWELDKNVYPREGDVPLVIEIASQTEQEVLTDKMQKTPTYIHTTGIICRTKEEAKAIHRQLEIPLLEDGGEYFGDAFVVTTIEVAKGLEFDQVILVDVSKENYHTEQERSMCYTCCTRAKHLLTICVPKGAASRFVIENQASYTKTIV